MNGTFLVIASTLGWIGAVGTVAAYGLVSTGRIDATSLRFQGANVACALFLALNAVANGSWPSAASNVVWMLIGVNALLAARNVWRDRLAHYTRSVRRRTRLRVVPPRTEQSAQDRSEHDLAA